jgi:hypothetical protein
VTNGLFDIRVECYSGHMAEETPRRVSFGARRVEVVRVLDRWLAPDHRYFKVEGDDGGTYLLRHDVAAHRWELTMYERRVPRRPDPAGQPPRE